MLDSVPIEEALARCDARFAREWYHWFFFAQPDIPERVINADPDAWHGVGVRDTPEATVPGRTPGGEPQRTTVTSGGSPAP